MNLRKAAEQALDALTLINQDVEIYTATLPVGRQHELCKAIFRLRQALSQPEWVGLTDEEMSELANKYKHIETGWRHDMDLIAEVEAKLKEKNT